MRASEPVTVLICALGGEGGGLLAQWITRAATLEGLTVSTTSVPGVAQRTGATSYYLEIQGPGAAGVMGLHPVPGRIDMLMASELVEAGRAVLRGFVTPDRTRLIASTHRVLTIAERAAPEDGRVDSRRIRLAARTAARQALLFDAEAVARACGSRINAVLLGALASSDVLPIPVTTFEAVLRTDGRGARANLAGFAAGLSATDEAAAPPPATAPESAEIPQPAFLTAVNALPTTARAVVGHGINRLLDYQGADHAQRYLERLAPIAALDPDGALTRDTARLLALLMSQEDVIRVAQLKIKPERLAQVRRDAGAGPGDPCRIHEFMKPGLAEAVALLPAALGRPLTAGIAASPRLAALSWPLKIESTSLWGFLLLRSLAALRPLRPFSFIHSDREALLDRWLLLVGKAWLQSPSLGREVVETASLIKGYASTLERTRAAFLRVVNEVVEPALAGALAPEHAADAVLQARLAARRDDDGKALSALIAALPKVTVETAA